MTSFWNWTTLLGKRSLIRCGRVFSRKGIRGQFKQMQLCLVMGHVVFFHIKQNNQVNAYQRSRIVSLVDAHITSGSAAISAIAPLAEGEDHFARRYQDGLESNDSAQDSLYIIWYRKLGKGKHAQDKSENAPVPPPPKLNAQRKAIVIKSRSRLERDAWCWSINKEIERLAQAYRDREDLARNAGGIAQD